MSQVYNLEGVQCGLRAVSELKEVERACREVSCARGQVKRVCKVRKESSLAVIWTAATHNPLVQDLEQCRRLVDVPVQDVERAEYSRVGRRGAIPLVDDEQVGRR